MVTFAVSELIKSSLINNIQINLNLGLINVYLRKPIIFFLFISKKN